MQPLTDGHVADQSAYDAFWDSVEERGTDSGRPEVSDDLSTSSAYELFMDCAESD